MIKACFNGCSFTVGEGFPVEQRDLFVYDRLITKYFNFERTNISIPGSSNYTIFMRSASAIKSKLYDIIFVQWSALNRLWLSPGPDSYFFTNDIKFPDFRYRDLYLSPAELKNFKNTILLMNHDYQNIFDLIDYVNFLNAMVEKTKTKIIYINGLVPWANDLCSPIGPDLSKSLSDYSKSILDFDHRDDQEIIKFFSKLQTKFQEIDQKQWVNLFDSFRGNTIDIGPLGHHPGINSHQWMANKIINYIKENNIL